MSRLFRALLSSVLALPIALNAQVVGGSIGGIVTDPSGATVRGAEVVIRNIDTGAERVLATHGRTTAMVRWLREQGINAAPLATEYVGESDDLEVDTADASDADPAGEAPSNGEMPAEVKE